MLIGRHNSKRRHLGRPHIGTALHRRSFCPSVIDPLSVYASIVAIVQAGGAVGKGLTKILNLRNAPDILLALNSEVADLQCIIQDIDGLLRQQLDATDQEPVASVDRMLQKAKQALLKLESLLAYELTTVKGKDDGVKLDRSVWLRVEHKVQKLKDEIRGDKISLSSALSVLTSSVWLRGQCRIMLSR